jgi:hypothetical protein
MSDFSPPPLFCHRCGREIQFLCCLVCAMTRLEAADIVAIAKEIRALVKRPIGRVPAKTECVICGQSMPAGTAARRLAKHVWAHAACVRALRGRLDEAAPRCEPTPRAGELPFGEAALEVK